MKKYSLRKYLISAGCGLFLLPLFAFAVNDHVQDVPAMGWNSWNHFGCNINEATVLSAAIAMHKKSTTANWEGKFISMQDVGYQFINIDDCWEGSRTNGILQFSATQFPHGFVWMCDSIRRMGLLPGLYTSAGTATCQGRPAQFGYDSVDALQYARWGFQYLKQDWCNVPSNYQNANGAIQLYTRSYNMLHSAAQTAFNENRYPGATGPKYFTFSICNWGSYSSWTYGAQCGHSARMAGDISGSWGSVIGIVDQCINNNVVTYNKTGFFNDPDMLEVGNGGMNTTENQAHFDLWCQMQSPLLTGNDISSMDNTIFNILTNREVVAINQDSLNWGGRRVKTGTPEVWYKRCFTRTNGTGSIITDSTKLKKSIILLNRTTGNVNYSILRTDPLELGAGSFQVRDLWQHKIIDTLLTTMTSLPAISVAAHGTTHLLFTPLEAIVSVDSHPLETTADDRLASMIRARKSAQGLELYIPVSGNVTLFDVKGGRIASFFAEGNGSWCRVAGNSKVCGTFIAEVNLPGRVLAKTIIVAK